MSNVKDKMKDAGHAVAEAAGKAVDFVKDKTGLGEAKDRGISAITEHMPVYASCGTKVGAVDRVEDGKIKLTAKDSKDGQHHYLPLSMVDRVDTHVHLNKNSTECEAAMTTDSTRGSGSCGAMPS